ncbi:spore germination protein [Desmospora profundinema]|uniref:Spore germination protein n=1 Tax=Desmospora profundinema TaxID=1571184 RepID=A0ABU1INC9_9BACL|nr:spore germination protein [Desmospora profundinema]MDR6226206.1 spore germination protein [Desmospora profundinema]
MRRRRKREKTRQQPAIPLDADSFTRFIKNEIKQSYDLVIRPFQGGKPETTCVLVYIDGMTEMERVNLHILSPLQSYPFALTDDNLTDVVSNGELEPLRSRDDLITSLLSGQSILLLDERGVWTLDTRGWDSRQIEEPATEAVVRGPREGFVENVQINTTLIRRKIRDPHLSFVLFQKGKRTRKDIILAYITDVANPDVVTDITERLEQVDMDVLEDGTLEQLLAEPKLIPFPLMQNTERPDRVASALLEGQVVILVDGSPSALLAPVTLPMFFQSPEDYYGHWIPGTLIRILRYIAAFVTLFLPGLYIALTSYHQGLIPTQLAISIAETRTGVPFPAFLEALLMEVTIEILREAGVRLPRPVGQAVGIVGGLVIGEAAVTAGIVSPIMVIVVAFTAVSSFSLPHFGMGIALRYLRFIVMIFAASLGLYGVLLFFIFLVGYLMRLNSFGVDYMNPFVSFRLSDWKDIVLRVSWRLMKTRPLLLHPKDPDRK